MSRSEITYTAAVKGKSEGRLRTETAHACALLRLLADALDWTPPPSYLSAPAHQCKYRRELENHLHEVKRFIEWLDAEMKKPSSVGRGERVGAATSALEMFNDLARHRLGLKIR